MRIPEKEIKDYTLIARLIFFAQKKKYGKSLTPSKIWGRSPKLLYGLQVFYRSIDRKNSPLEPALRALLNVKVSQINSCSFCVDISSGLLVKRGISVEKISKLNDYKNEAIFTEKEKVALDYAVAMTRYDVKVSEELFKQVKMYFNDNEIIELTALIGYQNL